MHPDFPLPDVSWPPLLPFWEGAAERRLVIPACDSCGRLDWYPTAECRSCGAVARTWTQMSGRGRLFSWTVVHYAWVPQYRPLLPFTTGLVSLDEDPRVRLATMIVDAEPSSLTPDMPVEVIFRPLHFPPASKSVIAPFFRPSPNAGDQG